MAYKHEPLPDNERFIRLVSIQPGTAEADIVVYLVIAPFSAQYPPRYEALSYVWGTTDHPETAYATSLTSSGRWPPPSGTLSITRNLAVALRHLRRTDAPRVVWIDALCIDQANDAEKGPQVALMGEIYRRATRVVAWLGPEADGSDRAMA
ncbi:uncharacterized protein THITE_49961, partial [Thermothielavioides terrestris NRRL 8126]